MTRIRDKDDPQALSTEPEREYIITESRLNEILREVCKGATWTNYQRECVRSHPLAKAKPGDCPDCPILTGDDAKRFTEYMDNPPAKSPAALELIRQAADLAKVPVTDNTISSLISENARIGAELRRMTERADMLSGEHDAQIARDATLAENKRVLGAAWELFPEPAGGFRGGYLVGRKEIIRRLNTLRIQEPPE